MPAFQWTMRLRSRQISPHTRRRALQLAPLFVVAALVGVAASETGGNGDRKGRGRDKLNGSVAIDGTIALLQRTQVAARRFESRHRGVRVTVGASGDGNAIDSFCAGEVDIAEVARRLKPAERRQCKSSGTRYARVEVGREGIALVVSERNRFVSCLTVDQARSIWRADTPIRSWADVDPSFPAIPMEPVGWKPDSPPYTLLAQGLLGSADRQTRVDYEIAGDASEVAGAVGPSAGALGYLPVSELVLADGVRPLRLDGGQGCVRPTASTVRDASYPALSRPLDLNVNRASLARPEVRGFLRAYPASQRIHEKFTRR
jgi:phosphate transport system substrate-binding protein